MSPKQEGSELTSWVTVNPLAWVVSDGVRTLQLWMGCVGMEAQQINVGVRIRDRSVQFYRGGLPNAAGLERAHVCVTGWWKGSEKWLCSLTLPCSSTCTVFWNHSIPKLR